MSTSNCFRYPELIVLVSKYDQSRPESWASWLPSCLGNVHSVLTMFPVITIIYWLNMITSLLWHPHLYCRWTYSNKYNNVIYIYIHIYIYTYMYTYAYVSHRVPMIQYYHEFLVKSHYMQVPRTTILRDLTHYRLITKNW